MHRQLSQWDEDGSCQEMNGKTSVSFNCWLTMNNECSSAVCHFFVISCQNSRFSFQRTTTWEFYYPLTGTDENSSSASSSFWIGAEKQVIRKLWSQLHRANLDIDRVDLVLISIDENWNQSVGDTLKHSAQQLKREAVLLCLRLSACWFQLISFILFCFAMRRVTAVHLSLSVSFGRLLPLHLSIHCIWITRSNNDDDSLYWSNSSRQQHRNKCEHLFATAHSMRTSSSRRRRRQRLTRKNSTCVSSLPADNNVE